MGTGIPPMAANLTSRLPGVAVQLVSQPVVVGAIVALVLELVFVQLPSLSHFGPLDQASRPATRPS
jgi:xanthine/uracil permease